MKINRGDKLIELKGTATQIAKAVTGFSKQYPVDLIEHLTAGEWHFILNGIDVRVLIEEGT